MGLKTLWQKEKLLSMRNLSFCLNVFQKSSDANASISDGSVTPLAFGIYVSK